ncbi:hypothetical protein QJQ45_027947 [Haematococcus lacustris]|nr:hypothetical protein QJQ45_027947 [Haematococcus lacustris]
MRLFHEPGNEGVYECDACGTKDIRAGKNINHLLAHLSTRKCNFKESEAAKEMAKTDDNVKAVGEESTAWLPMCPSPVTLGPQVKEGSTFWAAGSFGCEEAANFSELAAMSKLFNERVAYGETGALYATGLLDPRYRGRHTELTHSQVMMADMCIAELASADGQGIARATARACAAGPSHASRGPKEPWYKVLFHEAPGNEGVYECDACGTKDIRAGKNINHLLAHLSTRKCNFKESEAAKEMAKTDDNVKEFVEKCVKRHKPASTSEPSCSQPAASAEQGGKQADIESLLGKWMYATGSSFRSVEVPEFKDLIHALRPDFIIPTRKKLHETYLGVQTTVLLCCMQMGGELLVNEYAATCDEVRARIDMAPYVSITCDAWSPSQGGEHILGWCVAWSGHAFMLDAVHTEDASVTALFMKEKLDLILDKHNLGSWLLASLELDRGSWRLASLELGKGSWLLASLELGKGSWLLASLELDRGSWRLASLELDRGSWRLGKLFNERVAYGETGALYATGLLDPRYRGRHTELTHSQVMMADMCIAELASADGQACHCTLCYLVIAPCAGTDRAAGDARFNLHQRWLMPKALQLVGLSNSVLDTVLTTNPCLWWLSLRSGCSTSLTASPSEESHHHNEVT